MAHREIEISIADIPTHLVLVDLPDEVQDKLNRDYSSFMVSQSEKAMSVAISYQEGEPFLPLLPGDWQVQTSLSGENVSYKSYFEQGWFNLKTGHGELLLRPLGGIENFLRVLYAWRCLDHDAILLHASGVIHKGRGFVFFGPSTSGKTTITRFSKGMTILSDDLVIIGCENEVSPVVRVFGVPFRGELPEAERTNSSAPLLGLFSLVKDFENRLVTINQAEAVAKLAACTPFVMMHSESTQKVLKLCHTITQRMPVEALHFRPDPEFWSVIDG